jgi:hypothetical protein
MLDRKKGRGQTKCSPWSSKLDAGQEANNTASEKFTVTKPPEPMEEGRGGGQDSHRVVAPVKKDEIIFGISSCPDIRVKDS